MRREGIRHGVLCFGKYSGSRLSDVPLSYLAWLMESDFIGDYVGLEDAIRREIARQFADVTSAPPPPPPRYGSPRVSQHVSIAVAQRIVEIGYREYARLHHPDTGGTTQAMQDGNLARDWLVEFLRSVIR